MFNDDFSRGLKDLEGLELVEELCCTKLSPAAGKTFGVLGVWIDKEGSGQPRISM